MAKESEEQPASAREHGFVLLTANASDFDRISAVEPFEWEAPWPD